MHKQGSPHEGSNLQDLEGIITLASILCCRPCLAILCYLLVPSSGSRRYPASVTRGPPYSSCCPCFGLESMTPVSTIASHQSRSLMMLAGAAFEAARPPLLQLCPHHLLCYRRQSRPRPPFADRRAWTQPVPLEVARGFIAVHGLL